MARLFFGADLARSAGHSVHVREDELAVEVHERTAEDGPVPAVVAAKKIFFYSLYFINTNA